MDPVGPWSAYASYNRLAGVQAGAASGDFHHHLASGGSGLGTHGGATGVPSTTSQLLLQAAHTTASLAGQLGSSSASPFNPGGFLSPPAVGYDAVFSPLFHHANPKPAHYSSTLQAQHRQVIAQAQAAVASKQSSVESELSSLRENYSTHHQTLAAAQGSSFFDQSSAPGGTSGLAWQGNNQLPSPFGILPHESVVPSSPGPATTKASAAYENFNAHFAAAQTLNNHLNSQLSSASKQAARAGSPAAATKPSVSSSSSATFFQTPTTFGNQTESISTYSTSNAKGGQLSSQQDYAGKQRANTASTVAPSSQQQSASTAASQDTTNKIMDKKLNVPVTGPGSGFMASYLKFLQGERDTSPPPAGRGTRKATWSRTNPTSNNKVYSPNEQNKNQSDNTSAQNQQNTNGAMAASGIMNASMPMSTPTVMSTSATISTPGALGSANPMHTAALLGAQSKGVEVDDPRYYNINKDRKRKYDGTEDSSYETGEDEARRLNKPVLNVPSTPLNDKGKKGRAGMNKPPPAVAPPQPAVPKKPRAPQPTPPVLQAQPQQQYYYQHQPDEVATHGAVLDYGGYTPAEGDPHASKKLQNVKTHQLIANSGQQENARPIEEIPYQLGEYVAIKSELNETWPSIWRVDGKTLLQKFEPFEQNGKVLYRNISTYAAWNPENKKLYTQVPVRVRTQSHLEIIVELVRSELQLDDCNFIEKRMLETQIYQENFEVYIQTLISHALDPNFLSEIFQEQDEYFLSNVKTVDEVTESMRSRVSGGSGPGARTLDAALTTWPNLSVACTTEGVCRACGRPAVARLLLYGQPYNPGTLEPVQPDARLAYEKEFLVCSSCCVRVQLYSRIAHQKYLMFSECSKRVADKRMQNPSKDTTLILNELLADESWLSQLFRDIRQSWAEAESLERKIRQSLPRQML